MTEIGMEGDVARTETAKLYANRPYRECFVAIVIIPLLILIGCYHYDIRGNYGYVYSKSETVVGTGVISCAVYCNI